jgi:outer membrane protein OmpA-like peptidoglycan-associated protein
MARIYSTLVLIAAASLAGGCSTTPPRLSALEDARTAVNRAEADPRVTQLAPVELQRARELLGQADSLWTKERDEAPAAHLAYLAGQQAAIAEARARQRTADAAIAQSAAERDRVRLDSRTREAELARGRADAAQAETQAARSSFEQAEQHALVARREAQAAQQEASAAAERATRLQQQLADLTAKQTSRGMVVTLQDVVFDVGQADLKPGSERFVERLATVLKENPDRRVRVEGFTDSQGSADYNQALSERRAAAVRRALVARGITPDRIEMQGYGKSFPVASNDIAAGRQLNRRVEVIISDAQGRIGAR